MSPDCGFDPLAQLATTRLGSDARLLRNEADERALADVIDAKLHTPLQADDAVQIALLNHRALQALYWRVGIVESDLVQAGRLHNPSFTFQRTHQRSDTEIERSLTWSLVSLLTAPLAPAGTARCCQTGWTASPA